jgi:hypothetical protein
MSNEDNILLDKLGQFWINNFEMRNNKYNVRKKKTNCISQIVQLDKMY